MSDKKPRERIPQVDLLTWLQANHPALHMAAKLDRDWIWLVADVRGEDKKAVREAIKEFGFIFSRHGGHTLPSGKVGMWGHSCSRPMPFNRRGKGAQGAQELVFLRCKWLTRAYHDLGRDFQQFAGVLDRANAAALPQGDLLVGFLAQPGILLRRKNQARGGRVSQAHGGAPAPNRTNGMPGPLRHFFVGDDAQQSIFLCRPLSVLGTRLQPTEPRLRFSFLANSASGIVPSNRVSSGFQ